MITIGNNAQDYFRRLIAQQEADDLGIRLSAVKPGTPAADCRLEFCEQADLSGDEWVVECEGFDLYVDAASVEWLDSAQIDFKRDETGGQLTIKAPRLKGEVPGADSSLVERVRYVLDSEINPGLASHKGHVQLVAVEADGTVVLRFGGGCHGCGMVDVTLRDGIERTLRERVPEVTAIKDATDHSTGSTPYYKRGAAG
jgi:Fe/S biogenesis protein NfuA